MGYRSDPENSSIIFDIPEEILDDAPDFGSDSDRQDDLSGDDDSSEPDDSASYQATSGSPYGGNEGLPDIIIQLQKKLLKGYTLPPCPSEAPLEHTLSRADTLSIQHYIAWMETHGTVKAYDAHARVLTTATQVEILSLYKVRKLAMDLTGLKPSWVDMCPKSCMAFTGDSHSQSSCSYHRNGNECNEQRYKPN